jgi:hypothetical protein
MYTKKYSLKLLVAGLKLLAVSLRFLVSDLMYQF